jgi:PleD family two-component response regulator
MNELDFRSTLLIVDDNKMNLNVLGTIFKEETDYKLAFATSGADAIDILASTKVDLVLLDVMMPEMDGFETCRRIKENKQTKDIPIIFLTAKTDTEDVVEGFRVGGVDYVSKPFRKEELICRIGTHLELKLAREKIKAQAEELREANRLIMRTLHQFGNTIGKK